MSLTATIASIREFSTPDGSSTTSTKTITSTGTVIAGYGYGDKNYVLCVGFTIDKPAQSITLKLVSGNIRGASTKLNYKILSAEDDSYKNATYTADSDGTVTAHTSNYSPKEFVLAHTLSAGTHYIYLWTSMSTDTNCYSQICHNGNGKITITYEELESAVSIYVDGAWAMATPQIYTNGAWVDATAQVYTNGAWTP